MTSNQVKLTRSKNGQTWEPYATVDLDDENTWPADLPDDVTDLLRQRLVDNNHVNSTDGYYYRIEG